jgi:nucleolar protein 16
MGRVLQKRKSRSSIPRVSQKPKSKKRHLANPIVAANWNKRETLAQNYRRLGLVSKLNKTAGGVQRAPTAGGAETVAGEAERDDVLRVGQRGRIVDAARKGVEAGEVRVERDEQGRIVRVVEDEDEDREREGVGRKRARKNPLNDPLNELEDSEAEEMDTFAHVPKDMGNESAIVREMEEMAKHGQRKAPRKQSQREQEWIERLIEKHGDDYAAMFKDARLNPMQQSEGDIKKRVRKYLQNAPGKTDV